jgi:hypothetical protein
MSNNSNIIPVHLSGSIHQARKSGPLDDYRGSDIELETSLTNKFNEQAEYIAEQI